MTTSPRPRMFFDAGCGPCTFWARVTAALSHAELEVCPLDGPEADAAFPSMPTEERYGSFHIVESGTIWTGPDAMPTWVGFVGGTRARRLVEKVPPVRQFLRFVYHRFWEYRRTRGCVPQSMPAV